MKLWYLRQNNNIVSMGFHSFLAALSEAESRITEVQKMYKKSKLTSFWDKNYFYLCLQVENEEKILETRMVEKEVETVKSETIPAGWFTSESTVLKTVKTQELVPETVESRETIIETPVKIQFMQLDNIRDYNKTEKIQNPSKYNFNEKFRLTNTFLALRENMQINEIKKTFPREFGVKLPEKKKPCIREFSHKKLESEFCAAILKRREELLGRL